MAVHHIHQLHLAQRNIHLYLGDRTAEGVCVGFDLVGALRRELAAVRQAVLGILGQRGQGHQYSSVRLSHDIAVDDIQVIGGHAGHKLRVIQYLLLQDEACLADGKARRIRLARCISAGAKGRYIRILAGNDVDLVDGNTHHIRRHLRISRICALADLRLSELYLEGTVRIHHHAAGRGLK